VYCVRKARDQRMLMMANSRRRLVLSEWTQVDLQDSSRWPDGLQCLHTDDRGRVHFISEDASRTVLPADPYWHGVTPFAPEFVDSPRRDDSPRRRVSPRERRDRPEVVGGGGRRDSYSDPSEGPSSQSSDSEAEFSGESGEQPRRVSHYVQSPTPSQRRRRNRSARRSAPRRRLA
jgi:hypothetical protein